MSGAWLGGPATWWFKVKFYDLFGGIGGFRLGLSKCNQPAQQQGKAQVQEVAGSPGSESGVPEPATEFRCVGYCDFDKHAVATYNKNFQESHNPTDVRSVADLGGAELLCAGFPCQAFSIAGKRGGFSDTRGTLFFEIARLAQAHRPRMLLLENVKGLLSHDDGRTFATILNTLAELGYWWEYQVLNSKNFGVPQNRERVFIVGHFGEESRQAVFPLRESGGKLEEECRKGEAMIIEPSHKHGEHREYEGICPTMQGRWGTGGDNVPYVIPVLTPDRMEKRQNDRRFKEDGEPAFSLTAQDKHGVMVPEGIRRLTPIECERLQGFLDGWRGRQPQVPLARKRGDRECD